MKTNIIFKVLISFITLCLLACSDDDGNMDTQMDNSVDLTTKIVGTYTGISTYSQGGSFFTEENRTATVSRSGDSTIVVRITSAGGAFDIQAKLSSELLFTADNAEILGDGPFAGNGSLTDNTLSIDMSTPDNIRFQYEGDR